MGELDVALSSFGRRARSRVSRPGQHCSARSPQLYLDIDRTKAESLGILLSDVFSTLQGYLGSSFVNLFNKFNQVFQVYIQADLQFRLRPRTRTSGATSGRGRAARNADPGSTHAEQRADHPL